MKTAERVTYGEKDMGCWLDCSRGHYIGKAVMEIAIAHGWCPQDVEDGDDFTSPDGGWYCEFWDEAEQYMDRFAAYGYWFGANEHSGDWGLWEVEAE